MPDAKPWWQSKTLLVVIVLTELLASDLVTENPQAVIYLAALLAVANGLLRYFTTSAIAVCLLCLISGEARAQVQLCAPQKLAALKASLPATVDPRWQESFNDPQTVFYTRDEMPPAYQLSITHGTQMFFHDARNNVSGDPSDAPLGDGNGGNANVDFPWRNAGGIAKTAERDVSNFTMFLLPRRTDGRAWPVVYWHEMRGAVISGPHRVLVWAFPVGTEFWEVLRLKDSTGMPHTFEARVRMRYQTGWHVEILRPYATAGDLIEALTKLGTVEAATIAARLYEQPAVEVKTLTDKHRTKHAFSVTAASEMLPAMPEDLVKRLLNVPFKNTAGYVWRQTSTSAPDVVAPTSSARFGLVPREYFGAFLGNDSQGCNRCHQDTLAAARSFDTGRGWYGFSMGNDRIRSWHPVEPSSVSRDGGNLNVVYRRAFISSGMWESYDPSKHPPERYTFIL